MKGTGWEVSEAESTRRCLYPERLQKSSFKEHWTQSFQALRLWDSEQVTGAGKERIQELLEESPLSHATLSFVFFSLNFLRENFTVLFGEN